MTIRGFWTEAIAKLRLNLIEHFAKFDNDLNLKLVQLKSSLKRVLTRLKMILT